MNTPTTGHLRALAADIRTLGLTQSASTIDAAADELAAYSQLCIAMDEQALINRRLRGAIRHAPHETACAAIPGYMRNCTCWKADAL